MANDLMKVEFESLSGIAVTLDANTVRNALTRGNGKVTDQEVSMFLRTCQAKRLDPFENGEVWLIKYGDNAPANLVVGYFAYIRRADKFPDYRGFKAGICVAYKDKDGNFKSDESGMPIIHKKEGAAVYPALGEVLIGGWCKVFRERVNGQVEESYMEVTLEEYSTGKSNWTAKPATMVRKVAVSQAFRAAFPNEYEGLYTEDEMVASGAIPANYTVNGETGEVVEDTKITQDQRQALFRMAREHLSKDKNEADGILKKMIAEEGFESTNDMPLSVYNRLVGRVMSAAAENENGPIQDADYKEVEDGEEAPDDQSNK